MEMAYQCDSSRWIMKQNTRQVTSRWHLSAFRERTGMSLIKIPLINLLQIFYLGR